MERCSVWRLRGEAVASCGNLDGVELLLKGTHYSITYNLTVLKWNLLSKLTHWQFSHVLFTRKMRKNNY